MKKLFKKSLAILLCAVMILSFSAIAFSADEKTPIVLIPGFGQSETKVYDEDGEFIGEINSFNLPNLDVKELIFDLVLPLMSSIVARKDVSLSKAAKEEVQKVFQPFIKNDDGSYKYKTVVREFNAAFDKLPYDEQLIVNGHVNFNSFSEYNSVRYFFTYDSFGSIKTAADRLHDYLHDVVLAQTGASKVCFVPISQGGTVFQEYLELYPEDYQYIKKIVNIVPAFDGSLLVGDVLTDNVNIYDLDYVHETILPSLLGETDAAYAVSLALRLGLSEETTVKVLKAALAAAIDCLITRSSMMWALCPTDEFSVSTNKFLSDPALSAVLAECEQYAVARENLKAHLTELMNNGVIVHTIASYDVGLMFAPLFGSNGEDADELLAPSSPSIGAKVAPLGGTLGDNYVSPHTYCSDPMHDHISPDGKIDASTAYLPENTWFFKGVAHTMLNSRSDVKNFAVSLIIDDSITDIYSSPKLTQFTDPESLIASSIEENGRIYYYDADGNYMYSEKVDDAASSDGEASGGKVTVLGIIHLIVNFFYRILRMLGIHIKQL